MTEDFADRIPERRMSRREVILTLSRWTGFLALAQTVDPLGLSRAVAQTATATTESVSVQVNLTTGTLINFGYRTPNGNQPKTFGDMAHLWAVSDAQVPWNRPPKASVSIVGDDPVGDQNFENVAITSEPYLVGYSVGPLAPSGSGWSPYANVVATAYIPPQNGNAESFSTCAKLRHIGATSLAFDFAFPPGFSAKGAGAWAGLWSGRGVSYLTPPPWSASIDIGSDAGDWGLDGLHLERGSSYTLGLFPSGYVRAGTGTAAELSSKNLAYAVSFEA